MGDSRDAIRYFRSAVQLTPQTADEYYNRSIAHYYLGDLARARDDTIQSLRLNPDYRLAKLDLARYEFYMGNERELGRVLTDIVDEVSAGRYDPLTIYALASFLSEYSATQSHPSQLLESVSDFNHALTLLVDGTHKFPDRAILYIGLGDLTSSLDQDSSKSGASQSCKTQDEN